MPHYCAFSVLKWFSLICMTWLHKANVTELCNCKVCCFVQFEPTLEFRNEYLSVKQCWKLLSTLPSEGDGSVATYCK